MPLLIFCGAVALVALVPPADGLEADLLPVAPMPRVTNLRVGPVARRPVMAESVLQAALPSPMPRTAVVVNTNAQRVGPRLISKFRTLVPERDLYITTSEEEAKAIVDQLVDAKYDRILTGGGDGTFSLVVDAVLKRAHRTNTTDLPVIGVLKLGTGNAVARYTGARRPMRDIRDVEAGRVGSPITVHMILAEGKRVPFAGVGFDAELINDYYSLKERKKKPLTAALFKRGIAGYTYALGVRTLPRYMRGRGLSTPMRITTLEPAWYVDPRNQDQQVERPAGTVLFEGSASMASVGAVPYYGGGIKWFPFAGQRAGTFQLRVLNESLVRGLANIGAVWRGKHRPPEACFEFLCTRIRIENEKPLPYQAAGESEGYRTEIEFAVDDVPIHVVNMNMDD